MNLVNYLQEGDFVFAAALHEVGSPLDIKAKLLAFLPRYPFLHNQTFFRDRDR